MFLFPLFSISLLLFYPTLTLGLTSTEPSTNFFPHSSFYSCSSLSCFSFMQLSLFHATVEYFFSLFAFLLSCSNCRMESGGGIVGSNPSQIHQASSVGTGNGSSCSVGSVGNVESSTSSSVLDRDYDHHKSFSTSHAICVRNLPVRSSGKCLLSVFFPFTH